MATLNTLRTRGALLLSIFIGVALIAFLLGDLTSASSVFQNRKNRIGSIDGNGVDYTEFMAKADNMGRVMQAIYGRSLSVADQDQVREMAWESYIRQYSYDPGYKRLGISVGETEQIDMVRGEYPSPVIQAIFSGGTGIYDPAALENFIRNKEQDTTGQLESVWQYLKKEMVDERAFSKYNALVSSAIFVNDLETGRALKAANTTFDGRFAMLPFSGIADSLITVTTAEAKKYYNAHKGTFRQTASRDIEYVPFEIAPSEADFTDIETRVREIATEFAAAADPMMFASTNSQERVDATYKGQKELPEELAAIAFGAGARDKSLMVGPTLDGTVWTMSRVGGERMMPDSVGARHILLDISRAAAADSLVRAIKGGRSIFDLAPEYSIDPTVDLGRFAPSMMVEPFAEAVMAAGSGDVFKVDTQFGTHVVQMTYKAPAVRKVQIATITYNVEPSAATEQAAYNKARDFLAVAAGSREKFNEAISSTGATARVANIAAGAHEVRGLADSRELVRWSFNSKPGTVSTIFEIDKNYVVAVVTGAKEEGFAKLSDVTSDIASRIRQEKKAEMLTEQMKGLSIAEIAALEGAKEGTFAAMKSTTSYNPEIGFEPAVIGSLVAFADGVSGLAVGSLSAPIKGYSGMYVLAVDAATPVIEGATDEIGERARLETAATSSLDRLIMQALRGESNIKDERAKFF